MRRCGSTFLLLLLVMFAGCRPTQPTIVPSNADRTTEQQSEVDPQTSYPPAEWRAYFSGDSLWVVQIEDGASIGLGVIDSDLLPNRADLHAVRLSPLGDYVVWDVAGVGVAGFSIKETSASLIYEASDWYASNPFFYLDDSQNSMWLIDDDGLMLKQLRFDDFSISEYPIDEAFGTELKISPDGMYAVIAAGFREDSLQEPEYLVVNLATSDSYIMQTDNELADRFSFVLYESMLVVFEDSTNLVGYELGTPETSTVLYELADTARINEVFEQDGYFFVLSADMTWTAIDARSMTLVRQLPAEVVFAEMERFVLHPYSRTSFLIEEIVLLDDSQIRRLWKSDMLGIKDLLVAEFGQIAVIE